MAKNYRAELVGAFGNPIDENPTGVMEAAAFAALGLDWRYLTVLVKQKDLAAAMAGVRAMNMRGINLTIPHKVNVLQYLDALSEAATIIGAVNTVVNRGGELWGDNTDGKGFLKSLIDEGVEVAGKHIVLLGCGGAARAVAVECALAGAEKITVAARNETAGRELAKLILRKTSAKSEWIPWQGALPVPGEMHILINATPLGLFPHVEERPEILFNTIPAGTVACDVVFNPPHTRFLREAAKRGARTINGLGMLVNQGALNFTLWTGREAPLDVMTKALSDEFGL